MQDSLIYLPLTTGSSALGWNIKTLTPRSATLSSGMKVGAVPVVYFNRTPYVALASLSKLPDTAAQLLPTGVKFTRSGKSVTFPLNVAALLPFGPQTEFTAQRN